MTQHEYCDIFLKATSIKVAGATRLELATSCVTGRRSNQLNYAPKRTNKWWAMTDSNRRPSRCKRDALPTELIALFIRLWTLLVLLIVYQQEISAFLMQQFELIHQF